MICYQAMELRLPNTLGDAEISCTFCSRLWAERCHLPTNFGRLVEHGTLNDTNVEEWPIHTTQVHYVPNENSKFGILQRLE